MASDRFRTFLSTVEEKLFPDRESEVLSPESPPDWTKLGWKVGYIVEEGHTGLQWWMTEEVHWDSLTESFGTSSRRKKQVFARWYGSLLEELAGDLGVPLNLESLKFRQMDLAAFEGRPLIEEEDWWIVRVGADDPGYWHLVLSERFLRVFDEDAEAASGPEPPWTFLELWGRLEDRGRRDLLQVIGDDEGLLNHLASLVVSGNLDAERLVGLMARQPREELERIVDRRRGKLDGASAGKRRQTLDRWREDAVDHLTQKLGHWLENEKLPVSRWKQYAGEWSRYRRDVLEETFGDGKWVALFEGLSERDLKQVAPRLDTDRLAISLSTLSRTQRRAVHEALPEALTQKIRNREFSPSDEREVPEVREELFEQGRDVVAAMDYRLDGSWTLGETED